MKGIFNLKWLAVAMCVVSMSFTMVACGGDDNGGDNTPTLDKQLDGKVWVLDGNKKTEFRFFRNHLVECDGGASTAPSALTSGDATFFGTWQGDNSLTTTFTSGTNGGFDWNSILYGTLYVKEIKPADSRIVFTSPDGQEHDLMHLSSYSQSKTFKDYTDTSTHDAALHGTWYATAYINNQAVEYTITVRKDGTVRWQQPDHDIDFTSSYTTRNGHVEVDHVLVPTSDKASYIYVREDSRVLFYTEDNATLEWSWKK